MRRYLKIAISTGLLWLAAACSERWAQSPTEPVVDAPLDVAVET